MANLLFGFFREVRCSETPRSPSRTGIAADTRALPKFVFIRVNFYLEYAKRIFMEITGGCVCGGTRYVLKSRPIALIDCHCIDCRRSAGAPYVQWGSVPRADLVITKGERRKISYANRIRCFAACCGTHLFFEDSEDSEMIDVTIASLDDPAAFAPQKAIWLEDKLPWVVIDESIPSFQTVPKKKS